MKYGFDGMYVVDDNGNQPSHSEVLEALNMREQNKALVEALCELISAKHPLSRSLHKAKEAPIVAGAA